MHHMEFRIHSLNHIIIYSLKIIANHKLILVIQTKKRISMTLTNNHLIPHYLEHL